MTLPNGKTVSLTMPSFADFGSVQNYTAGDDLLANIQISKNPISAAGAIPVSPMVLIELTGTNGIALQITNTLQPFRFFMPIDDSPAIYNFSAGMQKTYKCSWFDQANNMYKDDGCTSSYNDTLKQVECSCTHLTSFIAQPDSTAPPPAGGGRTPTAPPPLVLAAEGAEVAAPFLLPHSRPCLSAKVCLGTNHTRAMLS